MIHFKGEQKIMVAPMTYTRDLSTQGNQLDKAVEEYRDISP